MISSRFITGSDFGGPSVPSEYGEELANIINQMENVPFAYLIDVMFYFGGDFLEITDPTGMYSPRVSVAKNTATCAIKFNNADVLANPNPRQFLRKTFYAGMSDLFDRIAARDKSVNAESEREKIAFLKEDILNTLLPFEQYSVAGRGHVNRGSVGKLTFRTMFGGPAIRPEYSKELYRIQSRLDDIEFSYTLDMSMNVGGDMVVITDPTGLRSVRITPAKKNARGLIQLNSQEVLTSDNPGRFLRRSIHAAVMDLLERIARKDRDFDPADSREKLAFLLSDD